MNKKRESIEFDTDEIIPIANKLYDMGDKLGYTPEKFALMLLIIATNLCHSCGIDVESVKSEKGVKQ